MDIWSALRIIWRNRAVAGLGVLLTVAAVVVAGGKVEPEYVASAELQLLAPAAVADSQGVLQETNPWYRVGGAEGALASTLARVARSQRFALEAQRAGAVRDVVVGYDGAIVGIKLTAPTSRAALDSQAILIGLLQTELIDLQQSAGAPPQTWVTADPLEQTFAPAEAVGDRNKVMAAVGLLGLALSFTAAFVLEALRRGGRAGQGAAREPAPAPAGAPGPVPHPASWPPARGALPDPGRRKAIEAVAWAPPPDAMPFRLEGDSDGGGRDEPERSPSSDEVPPFRLGHGTNGHGRPANGSRGPARPAPPPAGRPDPRG